MLNNYINYQVIVIEIAKTNFSEFFHHIYKSYFFTEASFNSKEKRLNWRLNLVEFFKGLVKSCACVKQRLWACTYMCTRAHVCFHLSEFVEVNLQISLVNKFIWCDLRSTRKEFCHKISLHQTGITIIDLHCKSSFVSALPLIHSKLIGQFQN